MADYRRDGGHGGHGRRGRGSGGRGRGGYGRGGHGGHGNHGNHGNHGDGYGRHQHDGSPGHRGDRTALEETLRRVDGRPYPAYKDLFGQWDMGAFTLHFDHVQSDAYASPSRARVLVKAPGIPPDLYATRIRRTALCDYLLRVLKGTVSLSRGDVKKQGHGWKGEKGGDMGIQEPGQFVLERSSVMINPSTGVVEARFTIGLPAAGRTCLGAFAADILLGNLPRYVHSALQWQSLDADAAYNHVRVVEDSDALRNQLEDHDLIAFVGNGSILPRTSGASQEPLDASKAVPFETPAKFAVELVRPNAGPIVGMGIPQGISLVVGGGFHGKSTLLEALQTGIYDKVPGDGRENVVVHPSAAKVRSEDGRAVSCVDVSPYIGNLPRLDDGNESEIAGAGGFSEDEEESFADDGDTPKPMAITRPDGTPYLPAAGRPVILFDLNGVLVHHLKKRADGGNSWYHTHVLRPGVSRLAELKEHFDLGIYSSATLKTVKLAIASIELHLGWTDRQTRLFDVVLHREHCVLAKTLGLQRSDGNHWDTVKPLRRYFRQPDGYVLVDDSPHKSIPGEEESMIVVPEWTQGNETCDVLDKLVDGLLGICSRSFRQITANLRATFGQQLVADLETRCFSTSNASGSTSQAASIQEALEQGCQVLLIDEDTSATNFMLRDARMMKLISGDLEPITPLLHRIRALSTDRGVSTIVVVGGSGAYFDVCDHVIAMKNWRATDVTDEAKEIAAKYQEDDQEGYGYGYGVAGASSSSTYPALRKRAYDASPSPARHKVAALHSILVEDQELDLSGVEQLVELGQTNAISLALEAVATRVKSVASYRNKTFDQVLCMLNDEIDRMGLDVLGGNRHGSLSRPRVMELASALNRYRQGRFVQISGGLES